MRYVDIERLRGKITPEWLAKAQQALNDVRAAPPDKRNEVINSYSAIWSALKSELAELSHQKCWYCESIEVRGDKEVDHRRPKNAVKECARHKGYWWLAFEWTNFRYSCGFCNKRRRDKITNFVGGKGTSFPLLDETQRVFDECDPDELWREEPILLDPTEPSDPALLTFDNDGTARPEKDETCYPDKYLRAKRSIEIYHLNHTDLKEIRQRTCNTVERLVVEGKLYMNIQQKAKSDPAEKSRYQLAKHSFTKVTQQLMTLINERSEYSAAARAVLRMYRDDEHPWVDDLLNVS